MAKIPFKYYLHESSFHESLEWLLSTSEALRQIPEEDWEKVSNPFYEVTLFCEIDTETMEVTLTEARL